MGKTIGKIGGEGGEEMEPKGTRKRPFCGFLISWPKFYQREYGGRDKLNGKSFTKTIPFNEREYYKMGKVIPQQTIINYKNLKKKKKKRIRKT